MQIICTPSRPAWSRYLRVRSICALRIVSRLSSVLAASDVWIKPAFTIRDMDGSSVGCEGSLPQVGLLLRCYIDFVGRQHATSRIAEETPQARSWAVKK